MLRKLTSFLRDQSANFSMIMAILAIPVAGIVAGAVDYTMASRARTIMQNSLDAALLAAGRTGGDMDAKKAVAQKFLTVELGSTKLDNQSLQLAQGAGGRGLAGTFDATYKPFMLPILGINKIDIAVRSEVMAGTDAWLDVALVLDNTASLGPEGLDAVKNAAQQFRQTIFAAVGDPSRVQMGVVPFAGAVNVGRDFPRGMLDVNADAPNHALIMENIWLAQLGGCRLNNNTPPVDPGQGGVERSTMTRSASRVFAELFGVMPAYAGEAQDHGLPPGYTIEDGAGCRNVRTPPKINNFDLLAGLNNIEWGGCVEARADGFDTTDLPATAGNIPSLYVPYFWPDELDQLAPDAPVMTNDYMSDEAVPGTPPWTPPDWATWDGWGRTLASTKYSGRTVDLGGRNPFASGPNRGCPQPLTPLTGNQATVEAAINGMLLVDAGGTIVSEGAAWGWRVLSPAAPFQQANTNPNTKRFMVIMSDGENQLSRNPREAGSWDYKSGAVLSDYNAYGYLRRSRLGVATFDEAQAEIDRRTLETCANAKRDGIEIYTVLFKSTDERAVATLKACATTPANHFYLATSSDQLNATFESIAASVGRYRLTR